jgi:alkylhydroperoxidase family enzyme
LARRLGAKEEWIAAVRAESPEADPRAEPSLEGMDESWQVALRYAELVTQSGHAVTDQDYAQLEHHWNEGEIVEITMVIGLFAYFNRFNDALRVEVTR